MLTSYSYSGRKLEYYFVFSVLNFGIVMLDLRIKINNLCETKIDLRLVHVLSYNILGRYFVIILNTYNIKGWKLSTLISYWAKSLKSGFFSQLKIMINFHPKISYRRTRTSLWRQIFIDQPMIWRHIWMFYCSLCLENMNRLFSMTYWKDSKENSFHIFKNGYFFKIIWWVFHQAKCS